SPRRSHKAAEPLHEFHGLAGRVHVALTRGQADVALCGVGLGLILEGGEEPGGTSSAIAVRCVDRPLKTHLIAGSSIAVAASAYLTVPRTLQVSRLAVQLGYRTVISTVPLAHGLPAVSIAVAATHPAPGACLRTDVVEMPRARAPALPLVASHLALADLATGRGVDHDDVRRPSAFSAGGRDGTRSAPTTSTEGIAPCIPAWSIRVGVTGIRPHPAAIHVDPAYAPAEDIGRDVALRERLAGEDDGVSCGLESGSPPVPTLGVVGDWLSTVYLVGGVQHGNAQLATCGRGCWTPPTTHLVALSPGGLVQRLAHIQGLREAAAVEPSNDFVPDLESGQSQGNPHEIMRAGPGEAQEMPSGLEDSKALPPCLRAGNERIPLLAHEATARVPVGLSSQPARQHLDDVRLLGESVRRIGHYGVDQVLGQRGEEEKVIGGLHMPSGLHDDTDTVPPERFPPVQASRRRSSRSSSSAAASSISR